MNSKTYHPSVECIKQAIALSIFNDIEDMCMYAEEFYTIFHA